MKTINSISRYMLVAGVTFLFAFNGNAQNDDQSEEVLNAYLAVKDALVESDPGNAREAAEKLVAVIRDSNDALLVKIAEKASEISVSSDVKAQRKSFNDLSENVYQFMKISGDFGIPVYRQYCPMAFNNTGASWLAAEKEINNPYFGSMMLHCGSVKEEL